MSTDNGNSRISRIPLTRELLRERLRAHDIQRRHAKQLLWIELASLLEYLCGDENGGIDRVGNDQDEGLRAVLDDAVDERLDDPGVDLEEVVAGHAGLAGDAGGDDDEVGASEGELETVVFGEVAGDFL